MFRRKRYQFGWLELRRRKNGPSVWLWRYRSSSPKDGRDLDKEAMIVGDTRQYPRKADAWKAAEALRLGLNRPKPADEIMFGALVGRYLLEQLPERRSTASRYRSWLRCYVEPRWANVPLSAVKPLAVEEWIKSLKLAPKSKGHVRSIMHLLFEWAMKWELMPVDRNPIGLVRIKGSSKRLREPRALTIVEFQLLITYLKEPFRTMCIVAVCLGLRVSELLGLQWSDFDWDSLRVKIQRSWVYGTAGAVKTQYSEKWMPLDVSLAELLLQHRARMTAGGLSKGCEWVFVNPETGRPPWPSRIVENHFVPAGVATGIGCVGWHTFRHTYATMLGTFGVDMKVQQELLRHADIRTTMNIYTHTVPDALREANSKVVKMVLSERKTA
jgi:integrase